MVPEYTGLIHHVIRNHFQWATYTGYEDMIQQGYLGILRAKRDYDPAKGASFATYAYGWIRASIQRYVAKFTSVSVPYDWLQMLYRQPRGERGSIASEELRDKVSSAVHCEQLRAASEVVGEAQDDGEPIDRLSAQQVVQDAMTMLDERKVLILYCRAHGMTLEATAEELEQEYGYRLTRERVRQIEAKAKKQIREYIHHFYPQYWDLLTYGEVSTTTNTRLRNGYSVDQGTPKRLRPAEGRLCEGEVQETEGEAVVSAPADYELSALEIDWY